MLEKLKQIKFTVGTKNKPLVIILEKNCNLVKTVEPVYKGKFDFLIGWNVYSVVRFLFNKYKINTVSRKKNGKWIKVKKEKIKELSEQPMDTNENIEFGNNV